MIRANHRRLPENLKKFAKSVRKCFYLDTRVDRSLIEAESMEEVDDAVGIAVPPLSEMTFSGQRLDRRRRRRNHGRAV
jgi:hypothetical protein